MPLPSHQSLPCGWPNTTALFVDRALRLYQLLQGVEVFDAEDAHAAIAVLEGNSAIRIVFTDIEMPGSMDRLKRAAVVSHRSPPVRIVVTSGRYLTRNTEMPWVSLFLAKLYDPERLARSLRELVA